MQCPEFVKVFFLTMQLILSLSTKPAKPVLLGLPVYLTFSSIQDKTR